MKVHIYMHTVDRHIDRYECVCMDCTIQGPIQDVARALFSETRSPLLNRPQHGLSRLWKK